jgi:hypothetical protein
VHRVQSQEPPHAHPPDYDFGSVRHRARHSAALDRRGTVQSRAKLSPAILSALLAVSTGLAVLRGGRRCRYRRNNRHRADLAGHRGTAALRLQRAALLPTAAPSPTATAELLPTALSPLVRRVVAKFDRAGACASGEITSAFAIAGIWLRVGSPPDLRHDARASVDGDENEIEPFE